MSNPNVRLLKSQLGKEINHGPSRVSAWLRGKPIAVAEGELTVAFQVLPEFTNPYDILHGGVIAMIIDEMIGAASFSLDLPTAYVTANLNVNYLESVQVNETVTAKSVIVRQGRTIINGECALYNAQGKLVAKGTANMVNTNHRFELPKPSDG